jgi:hypothetical protein
MKKLSGFLVILGLIFGLVGCDDGGKLQNSDTDAVFRFGQHFPEKPANHRN